MRSKYSADIRKGILLLEDLYGKQTGNERRDCLYYLAIGNARLKVSKKTKKKKKTPRHPHASSILPAEQSSWSSFVTGIHKGTGVRQGVPRGRTWKPASAGSGIGDKEEDGKRFPFYNLLSA